MLIGGVTVKIYKRVWLLAAGSVVTLALSPTYAFAIAPTVETVTLHRDFGVVGSCPGFDVTATFDPTRRITTFYNGEGTPIRQQIHAEVPGTVRMPSLANRCQRPVSATSLSIWSPASSRAQPRIRM